MPNGPGTSTGCQRVCLADAETDGNGGYESSVAILDGGPAWAVQNGLGTGAISSADATTGLDLTSELPADQVIQITDMIISVDTAMTVTIEEATSGVGGTNIVVLYMAANTTIQITPRSWIQVNGASGKKVRAITSAAGNISITFLFRSNI